MPALEPETIAIPSMQVYLGGLHWDTWRINIRDLKKRYPPNEIHTALFPSIELVQKLHGKTARLREEGKGWWFPRGPGLVAFSTLEHISNLSYVKSHKPIVGNSFAYMKPVTLCVNFADTVENVAKYADTVIACLATPGWTRSMYARHYNYLVANHTWFLFFRELLKEHEIKCHAFDEIQVYMDACADDMLAVLSMAITPLLNFVDG